MVVHITLPKHGCCDANIEYWIPVTCQNSNISTSILLLTISLMQHNTCSYYYYYSMSAVAMLTSKAHLLLNHFSIQFQLSSVKIHIIYFVLQVREDPVGSYSLCLHSGPFPALYFIGETSVQQNP